MDNSKPLTGKVALVTGGAGGIGTAISRHLADAGASVVLTYNSNGARAEALARDLPGGGHLALQMRVDESGDIAAAVEQVTVALWPAGYPDQQRRHDSLRPPRRSG